MYTSLSSRGICWWRNYQRQNASKPSRSPTHRTIDCEEDRTLPAMVVVGAVGGYLAVAHAMGATTLVAWVDNYVPGGGGNEQLKTMRVDGDDKSDSQVPAGTTQLQLIGTDLGLGAGSYLVLDDGSITAAPASRGTRLVLATVHARDRVSRARLALRYRVRLVRRDRWYVAAIDGTVPEQGRR